MNSRHVQWFLPLLVLAALSGITIARLRDSAALRRSDAESGPAANPYSELAQLEERLTRTPALSDLRDPFVTGTGRRESPARPVRRADPAPASTRERPVLTAIVSDADPRALLRYEGRNYTVKVGDLFAEFRVVSVSADRVVLEAGSERIVLNRPVKGE